MQDYQPQSTWIPGPPQLTDDGSTPTADSALEPDLTRAPSAASPRAKRLMAAGLLAIGMIVGGAAIVSAASPDPSASTAPAAGGTTTPGATGMPGNGANCPNM